MPDRRNKKMDAKVIRRQKIRYRIRRKSSGTAAKPRISVFRSNTEIYAQIIDDATGQTLAAASSKDKSIAAQKAPKADIAKMVGTVLAQKAIDLGIKDVIFDRGGYLFHGRVKALAEGAREGGLQF